MTSITFDTLKFVNTLKEAGFQEKQAEAVSNAIKESFKESDLVTNQHLSLELERTKADMIKWIAGLLLAQAAIIATLVKIL